MFETLEAIETFEISLDLIGVSAFARRGEAFGARLCAEAMGTEAVHRALVRFAQGDPLANGVGTPVSHMRPLADRTTAQDSKRSPCREAWAPG